MFGRRLGVGGACGCFGDGVRHQTLLTLTPPWGYKLGLVSWPARAESGNMTYVLAMFVKKMIDQAPASLDRSARIQRCRWSELRDLKAQ